MTVISWVVQAKRGGTSFAHRAPMFVKATDADQIYNVMKKPTALSLVNDPGEATAVAISHIKDTNKFTKELSRYLPSPHPSGSWNVSVVPLIIEEELGTSGKKQIFTLSHVPLHDVKRALELEYRSDFGDAPNTDDVAAAYTAGFVYVAAHLWASATTCPLLTAVVKVHEDKMYKRGSLHPVGWDAWSTWFKVHSAECPKCGSHVISPNGEWPQHCGNCLSDGIDKPIKLEDYRSALSYLSAAMRRIIRDESSAVAEEVLRHLTQGDIGAVRTFLFKDLSKEAKQRVIDRFRESGELEYNEDITLSIQNTLDEAGLPSDKVHWNLRCSQSDHVTFEGLLDIDAFIKAQDDLLSEITKWEASPKQADDEPAYIARYKRLLYEGIDDVKKLQEMSCDFTLRIRSSHFGCSVITEEALHTYPDGEEELSRSLMENVETTFSSYIDDVIRRLKDDAEREIDEYNSDEYIEDLLEQRTDWYTSCGKSADVEVRSS